MYHDRTEKIVATIEARMGSKRLPGKVLMPLAGKPVLQHLIERLQRSIYLDDICVATTKDPHDDDIATLARDLGVSVFRGSEEDVLGRVLGAAQSIAADIIVEITGDCPGTDPVIVDRCIDAFFLHDVDYVANNLESTYPTGGFEVQVFRTMLLRLVADITQDPIDRTHVSYYIYQHPELYRLYNVSATPEAIAPELRFVLDYREDYDVISRVFEELYPVNPDFSAEDVVQYLKAHPEVAALNKAVVGKQAHEL